MELEGIYEIIFTSLIYSVISTDIKVWSLFKRVKYAFQLGCDRTPIEHFRTSENGNSSPSSIDFSCTNARWTKFLSSSGGVLYLVDGLKFRHIF